MIVLCFGLAAHWEPQWQGLLLADAGLVVLALVWSLQSREEVAPALGKLGMRPAFLPLLALGGFVTWGLASVLMSPVEQLLPEWVEEVELPALFPHPVLAVLSICVVPGVCEELIFRGILQGSLARVMGPRNSLVVAAVIFAAVHFNPLGFWGYLFPLGLYLGWLRLRTGSLYPGIVAHFSHNAVAVIAAYMSAGT